MPSFTPEQIQQYAAAGLHMTGTNAKLTGNLNFEPPVTLDDCNVVGPSHIGRHSYVGDYTHIAQMTTIGRYCSIGNSCTIGAQSHPLDWLSSHPFQYVGLPGVKTRSWPWVATTIGNDVWIGANVVVTAGITVGDGAAIGGGAVVTKDVPPYAVVVGNPGRVLKTRFSPEVVAELLTLKWWDLPLEAIKALPFNDIDACLISLRRLRA